MESGSITYDSDLDLATQASRGVLSAWHEFVLQYSGLIRAMVRRHHPGKPEDDQLTLYVEVLEYMYSKGLRRYDGRAALSTWVMTVTRSRCLDAHRRETGRRRPPGWLAELPPLDRRIYQLYYVEFQTVPAILARLDRKGHDLTEEALEEVILRLESRLDRHMHRRLAYELEAHSIGALSGRLLETLDHLRLEQEEVAGTQRPDHELFQKQARLLLEEIGACVLKLGEPERRVIELRFYEMMSAPGIARRLNLTGPRRAYALIDKALSLMHSMLEARRGSPPSACCSKPLEDFFRRT